MSGTDQIVVNTRERASSGDINDLQSLKDRTMLDLARAAYVQRFFALGSLPAESPRNVCIGGFVVSPAGVDITISAGAIMQESAVLAPAPGALDSTYRVALLRSPATETPPAPGVETFYLLEAQMTEVVALSTIRDIFDTGTGLFVPTLVDKRTERVPAFQFVAGAGGNAPAPSGGDWVPIAIIRRPGGGGPIAVSDVYDVRRMWDAELPKRDSFPFTLSVVGTRGTRFLQTIGTPGGAASNLVLFQGEAFSDPQRLWYSRTGSLDLSSAEVLSPTTVFAADTWYYLYLVPWQRHAVVSTRDPFATGRGILVLTDVDTASQGQIRNGAPIDLPTPWGVTTLIGGLGVCVGAMRRNAANTGWEPMYTVEDNEVRLAPGLLAASFAPIVSPQTFSLATFVPTTAKTALLAIRVSGNGPGGLGQLAVAPTGSTVGYETFRFENDLLSTHYARVPLIAGLSFDLVYAGAGAQPDVIVDVIGYSE